jgi:hypothetical protein
MEEEEEYPNEQNITSSNTLPGFATEKEIKRKDKVTS